MSKKKKWPNANKTMEAINTYPIYKLYPIAKIVCSSDYEVYYYYNRHHPLFYRKPENLRKALRRCYSIGAFDHRETIERMLEQENPDIFLNDQSEENIKEK